MSIDFKLAIRGDLEAAMVRDGRTIKDAAFKAVRDEMRALKDDFNRETRRGLGRRNLVGAKILPRGGRGPDAPVSAVVFSKWWRRQRMTGEFVDLLEFHSRGGVINAQPGGFLVVPAPGTSRRQAFKSLGRLNDDPKLELIPQSGGSLGFALVRRTSRRRTSLIAFLRRRVTLKARLNFGPAIGRSHNRLQRRMESELAALERNQ